jgi:hypothetical protein
MAGASERAGFMDAPQIGPANMASSAITAPMAIPAVIPFSFAPVETFKITNIKRNVRINSKIKDCMSVPAGNVVHSVACAGKRKRNIQLAVNAPKHWAEIKGSTCWIGKRPDSQNALVTAGFKCAPEMSPTA